MVIQVKGIKELEIKFTRFNRFLGQEYNKAMVEVGKYGTITFHSHINQHKTESGKTWKRTRDLKHSYKDIKFKKWGKIYPILRASDKMYEDIKYFMNIAKGAFQSKKIKLSWGFRTKRSQKIAGYHHKGIMRKRESATGKSTGWEKVIRDPWFFTKGEISWITKMLKMATMEALRKARLKTI